MRTLTMFSIVAATLVSAAAQASPSYRAEAPIPLGAPDRWDYVVADAATGRVYVAHSDRLTVVDAKTRTLVGDVTTIPGGTHGTAIAGGRGFTDDGRNGQIVAFDLKTLKITATIPAQPDSDGMAADAATGHIFAIAGDPGAITVVDARSATVVATIKVGEKMEYAADDGAGTLYVAGEEKSDLVKIDARTNQVVARWSAAGCASPHGLAYDAAHKRLFMGCVNSLMFVFDATDGHVVARLPIGLGSDAVAFDPKRRRVFSSNGRDGTVSIYQQVSPDQYTALETLRTAVSARTMAVDPASGRLFIAAADTTLGATPGGRPAIVPGSLKLLVFAPVD